MVNTEFPKWVNDLNDRIAEELSDSKTIKFNTHRNRKVFIDKINKLINEILYENVPSVRPGRQGPTITKLHQNPERGVTVMTKGESERGDEFLIQKGINTRRT